MGAFIACPIRRSEYLTLERSVMNLKQYFKDEPYGSKKEMAEYLGITQTWLGLLIKKSRQPSPELAKKIEKATGKLVTAKELRPDIFD
jgi:DNA-binding transcriptional regulator YdaS (Cro superfamily)